MKTMKTLIEIDRDLWFRFRGRAFNRGLTVRDLLAEVVARYLGEDPLEARPSKETKPSRVEKPSSKVDRPRRDSIDTPEEPTTEDEEEPTKGKSSRFRGKRE